MFFGNLKQPPEQKKEESKVKPGDMFDQQFCAIFFLQNQHSLILFANTFTDSHPVVANKAQHS